MTGPAEALRYAVRPRVLTKYLGQLCLIIAALTTVPMIVCLLYGEFPAATAYLAAVGLLAGGGIVAGRLQWSGRLQTNEAVVLAAFSFILAPLAAVVPFMLAGMSAVDAIFETVSGVTTTGLTMLSDVGTASAGLIFGRAWMQWYGGLGIVVFSLVLILRPGTVARDMADTEDIQDDLLGGVKAFASRALSAYVVMTVVGAIVLLSFGVNPITAVLYALAAVSTGGFAPQNNSAAALGSWPVQSMLMLICLAGSLPIPFYIRLWRRVPATREHIGQVAGILVVAIGIGALMVLDHALNRPESVSKLAFDLPWLAFSAQTTSGFSIMPVTELSPASKIALMFAMSIGGGVGSTAGGIKIVRLMAVLRLTQLLIYRSQLAPHAVLPLRFAGRNLDTADIQKFLLLPLLFGAVVMVSWLVFVLLGYPPLDALFDVVSAVGTVGLSTGITGKELPVLLKLVLCGDMLLGRLEIIAWLVVLSPKTWIGRRL